MTNSERTINGKEIPVAKVKVGMELLPDHGKVKSISHVRRVITDYRDGATKGEKREQNFIVFVFTNGSERWHLDTDKVFQGPSTIKKPPRKKVAAAKPKGPSFGIGEFSKARGQKKGLV